ncbi:MAG: zf-HC2 domain-containing protein [bacterium]
MKASEKNEIDLLLRALGRDAAGARASSLQAKGESGVHLDADELNCYAEGIVSSAERARYNQHLADCESCRQIVIDLVPAAGVARRYEVSDQKMGWNWREKFSALFAPSVLRYAVPALTLTAVIAIAIVALRQRQHTEFVAQNRTQTAPVVSSGGEVQTLTTKNGEQPTSSPNQPQQPLAGAKDKNLSGTEKVDALRQSPVAENKPPNTDRAAQGFIQPGQSAGVAESKPIFAPEPSPAAPPPAPGYASSDADNLAEVRKQKAEEDLQKRRREDSKSQPRDENEVARPTASAKGGPSRSNNQGVAGLSSVMSRTGSKDEKAAGNEVETRRVSGRLFHRQGNAWIDADYASGRATVNVTRGSEQFRSLTADEPALRSIAEQLGGEVIVVWKGTAYRIR